MAGEQYGAPATETTAARQQPSPVQLERVWQPWLLLLARAGVGSPASPSLFSLAELSTGRCYDLRSPPSILLSMARWGRTVSSMTPGLCRPISLENAKWGPQKLSPCKSPKKKTGEIRHDGGTG